MGMEEERPIEEDHEAPDQQADQETTIVSEPVGEGEEETASSVGEDKTGDDDAPGMSHAHRRLLTIGIVVVVALIILGLFLPPVSLGERLGIVDGDETPTVAQEEAATAEPEAEVVEDGEVSVVVTGDEKVKSKTVTQEDFLNGEADDKLGATASDTPENRTLVSDVFLLDYKD